MPNSYFNKNDSCQNGLALGISVGLICASVINNLGIGLAMGIVFGMLFQNGFFRKKL
ncbi:hypothetical protein [Lacrimispora sp. 38-1]|uniref:hypothetical protein n=1 Tax=Lacrimispora sp. 38-1 TaxID=3125778 RepID=UPI003CEB573A